MPRCEQPGQQFMFSKSLWESYPNPKFSEQSQKWDTQAEKMN